MKPWGELTLEEKIARKRDDLEEMEREARERSEKRDERIAEFIAEYDSDTEINAICIRDARRDIDKMLTAPAGEGS